MMLSESDQNHIMNTMLLELSIETGEPVDNLSIVRQKKQGLWFIKNEETGRGIIKMLDNEL